MTSFTTSNPRAARPKRSCSGTERSPRSARPSTSRRTGCPSTTRSRSADSEGTAVMRITDIEDDRGGTLPGGAGPRPLSILIVSRDCAWSRPLRRALVRRGARPMLASGMAEAERLAAAFPPEVLLVGDELSEELASRAMGLARRQKPSSELVVLDPGERREPSGMGLGLLYSGHRSAGAG